MHREVAAAAGGGGAGGRGPAGRSPRWFRVDWGTTTGFLILGVLHGGGGGGGRRRRRV